MKAPVQIDQCIKKINNSSPEKFRYKSKYYDFKKLLSFHWIHCVALIVKQVSADLFYSHHIEMMAHILTSLTCSQKCMPHSHYSFPHSV